MIKVIIYEQNINVQHGDSPEIQTYILDTLKREKIPWSYFPETLEICIHASEAYHALYKLSYEHDILLI